ncbi:MULTISPECIES: nucleoid-associated protein YejK [Pseudoalteromonas]|uniref:Nucleoid-associated protein YejK n=2 Tax=Pseudoalteromonas TaxID=53246 RepID=A0AAD0RGY6_PSEO7|nr:MULTISPECIES: nucleoid-associated protein YejK [Pseudoalteromonas]ASD66768.1 nucleoid-associated protein YejK [Pseudoalteromonas piscicida]AXQ97699.1 nucleoid-associated protein YejK [Pseudoalteromonas piscicida]AXR02517.1 nucleoid-associated protein YejK [Pseudoalteromonas piscicida]KID33248.1 nucleoid-associated protein NdpA [Pseudoalteromonas flavipulchra NCIMB 2033 = ATCC BAA-314]KJY88958.1 nucleoid-associated protein NdpA [Pseudoalteromonas piscicida]
MSVEVKKLVVHYVDKQDEDTEIHLRDDEMQINDKVNVFIEQLHHAYNGKPGKGFCAFSGEKSSVVASAMQSYRNNELNFWNLTQEATNVLKEELNKYAFHETGYLVFCHYQYVASNFIMIALINIKEHYTITSDLDLSAAKHLDISRMQLAARIDLDAWDTAAEENRYISFIKGRAGRKVADFFLDFLGCEEGIDPKQQSQTMLHAVEDYLSTQQFEKSEKDDIRKEIFDYCNDCVSSGEDADVNTLSETLSKSSDVKFEDFYKEQGYELEESFPVDKKTVTSMVKFSGLGGGVSVGFERKHLGERVIYDAATDTLTIKGVPPNLKDQIERYYNDES